jgi:hypothetical protein
LRGLFLSKILSSSPDIKNILTFTQKAMQANSRITPSPVSASIPPTRRDRPSSAAPQPATASVQPSWPADQVRIPADNTRVAKAPVFDLGLSAIGVTPADWGNVTVADRQTAAQQLQTLAQDLKAQKRPGVEIWSRLTQAAVDNYAGKQIDPRRKADFVMQDLAIAVIGKDALKHLQDYQKLPWVRNPDPLVKTFQKDWQALGIPPTNDDWAAVGWAGDKLDTHAGADFRPQINDKSENQIFHTLFYQYMAYTTQDAFAIRGGSIVHEVRDAGTSPEDHNASYVGVMAGKAMRQTRDGASPADGLKQWGAMTQAAYGKNGTTGMKSVAPEVKALEQQVTTRLSDKSTLWKAENVLIGVVSDLKRLVGATP